jgi:apolipoprotein N-acyltransferase
VQPQPVNYLKLKTDLFKTLFRSKIVKIAVLSVLSGLFFGLAQPPFNQWELTIVAISFLVISVYNVSFKQKFLIGFISGVVQYVISLTWVTGFSVPGYLVIVLYDSLLIGVASLFIPAAKYKNRSALLKSLIVGLSFSLIDAFKSRFPFGGLPIDGFAISQSDSFFRNYAILGGEPLIVFAVFTFSALISYLFLNLLENKGALTKYVRTTEFVLTVLFLLIIVGSSQAILFSENTTATDYFEAVAVQGGGKTGLRAVINGNQQLVFYNQFVESLKISKKVNFILWPEDTVGLTGPLIGSGDYLTLKHLAINSKATLLVGVTEPKGSNQFLNLAVMINPKGKIIGSYLKVHRVPFGEYVPYRPFFQHFGNVNLVPRDAVKGTKPGVLNSPVGKIGIMISFEVFFDTRAFASVKNGAEVMFVPTNTASYVGVQMPSQELGALKIRAVETDRYILMTSPTGYSAEVTPHGNIVSISKLNVPALIYAKIGLIRYKTLFDRIGDTPILIGEMFSLLLLYALQYFRKTRSQGSII